MKRLSRKAKLDHIEKKIEIGLEKIPVEDKIRIENDEKMREKKKLQEIKQSLWKLRKKEKKLENPATENIKNMVKKLETIKEILDREREKLARKEEQKRVILKKKEQAEKIRKEKAKKWAMLRWINEFIEENQEKWDELDLIRTMEEHEKYEREEKKSGKTTSNWSFYCSNPS